MSLLHRLGFLLALEGVALVILGTAYAVASMGEPAEPGERLPAQLAAGAAALTGVLLLVLARAASRGRGWSRSPAVVLNVFPFPLALSAAQAGDWWAALPMVLLAGSVLYLFATPELRETFREG